jgi:AcrR family transcriptional regulator
MNERRYSSPLREQQARQTREAILDALTDLLGAQRADQVSTRAIAERAGVSQPTVYRHFPDRQALLEGLSDRIGTAAQAHSPSVSSLDELTAAARDYMALAEAHAVETAAEALLNADPRRYSRQSRARSEEMRQLVAKEFSAYSDEVQVRITALLRSILSVQTWLRMREEFGVPGTESGAVVAWALQTLVREIRAGSFPDADTPQRAKK